MKMTKETIQEGDWIFIKTTSQIGIAGEKRSSGWRIADIGLVPFEELRLATKDEISKFLNS